MRHKTSASSSPSTTAHHGHTPGMRLDKWLWAARFFKTRTLAGDEIERGRVTVNGQTAKPSRELRVGDRVGVRQGSCPIAREVSVRALSEVRGPAPQAQQLYEETPESVAAQTQWQAQRPYTVDPAQALTQGRPTKADRRQLVEWQRWSVSIDDPH